MENYKGYNIMEVFRYTARSIYTGEPVYLYSDWHVENPDTETSFNEHKKSIAQVRERIDEMESERAGAYEDDQGPIMGMSY